MTDFAQIFVQYDQQKWVQINFCLEDIAILIEITRYFSNIIIGLHHVTIYLANSINQQLMPALISGNFGKLAIL